MFLAPVVSSKLRGAIAVEPSLHTIYSGMCYFGRHPKFAVARCSKNYMLTNKCFWEAACGGLLVNLRDTRERQYWMDQQAHRQKIHQEFFSSF